MRLICLIILVPLFSSGQNVQQYYSEGISAYRAKDYKTFYEKMIEANKLHPYHQGIQYQLGQAAALTGKNLEAITYLKKAILTNTNFIIGNNPDLEKISGLKEYQSLLELQKKWKEPIVNSDTAFIITDRQLHVEGIDYDKKTETFYLGSIHKRKVIKVDSQGNSSYFCASEVDGMTSVFGLKADTKRNLLWVCSSPMPEMQNFDSTARSAVFKFDLETGTLLQKFPISKYEPDGVFGDLILNSKGQPFVSDGKNNKIFVVNESGKLESVFSSEEFWNIQGIAFNSDEKFLYISDYIKGIFRLNMTTKILEQVNCSLDVSLKGIDGLYFVDNSLIAIQNGVNPFRVTRYYLNKEGNSITRFEVLENNHPAYGEPTLGVLNENNLYYIANSQWSGYDKDHKPKSAEQLQDIVILKHTLSTKK
jgi:DNA-binding beta-propeller fold protein YncE